MRNPFCGTIVVEAEKGIKTFEKGKGKGGTWVAISFQRLSEYHIRLIIFNG